MRIIQVSTCSASSACLGEVELLLYSYSFTFYHIAFVSPQCNLRHFLLRSEVWHDEVLQHKGRILILCHKTSLLQFIQDNPCRTIRCIQATTVRNLKSNVDCKHLILAR